MTDKAQLLELAIRCEHAAGADRELDVYIALVTGELQHAKFYEPEQLYGAGCHAYNGLAYTASLDAAMTLVPEEFLPLLDATDGNEGRNHAALYDDTSRPTPKACAKTLPLALCAAALRARAAQP